ncbi:MAG TPA: hypothetical protein VM575_06280 [Nocardioides sp.]|nr:hypothetical protein [Nocardioides sp.]
MPDHAPRRTEHQVIALCGSLALLIPLRFALAATSLSGVTIAVAASVPVAGAVGMALRPEQRRGGAVSGLAVAVPFWPIALVIAWVLGPDADLTGLTLLTGLPAAALSAVVLGEVLRDDEVTSGFPTVAGIGVVVLALAVLVPGTVVRHDRERALIAAARGAELASVGIQPWLPEIEGYQRTDGPLTRDYLQESSYDYSLLFESGDHSLSVHADLRDPDRVCTPEGGCTEHEGYTVDESDTNVTVAVLRGDTELSASVAGSGLSIEDIARALLGARPAAWEDIILIDLDED